MRIHESNPSFEAQVRVEFDWQETETAHSTAATAGIDGVLHATILPSEHGSLDVAVGRAHYGLNLLTVCFDLDEAKREAARMAVGLLADICAEANEAREASDPTGGGVP